MADPIERLRFAELVDVPALQALLESFQKVIGIANAIIDLEGVVIAQSGWQELCTRYHRINPATCRRCVESDTSLAASMTRGEHLASYRCLNGLMDTASPIVVAGRHLANIFTGQFFTAPPDLDFFRGQARQFGFDEAGYLAAVAKVPVISQERAEAIVGVYSQLAQVLAATGLDRLRQRQAEEGLRRVNLDLERQTRELETANRELEEFSYSMSHDLRTPLRAIAGFAQILTDDYGGRLDDEGRRLLGVVRDNATRMGRLMDSILHFLRLGRVPLRPAAVDMAALAREVFAEVAVAGRQVEFQVGELPVAWGDPALVREILAVLLANAVKYTAPKAGVAAIRVAGEAADGETVYHVSDNGIGFDMRYVDKLFHVFERVHPTSDFEGSGIGLAIVKRIVQRHGGRVWAEGQVGQGATVHFALPAKGVTQ